MSQRIYRDPVHNIIPLRDDSAEGRLMIHLIDTPEFQKLHRTKQLGLDLRTHQGAEHSRFTHSLGARHLMTRILDQLGDRSYHTTFFNRLFISGGHYRCYNPNSRQFTE